MKFLEHRPTLLKDNVLGFGFAETPVDMLLERPVLRSPASTFAGPALPIASVLGQHAICAVPDGPTSSAPFRISFYIVSDLALRACNRRRLLA